MQHCADTESRKSIHLTSILSVIYHCVQIVLCTVSLICAVICAKTVYLMYSYKKHMPTTKHQMIGHLRGDIFRGVLKFKKHLHDTKNNCWHFNRVFTGATLTTNMWNNTSVMMSGKFGWISRVKQICSNNHSQNVVESFFFITGVQWMYEQQSRIVVVSRNPPDEMCIPIDLRIKHTNENSVRIYDEMTHSEQSDVRTQQQTPLYKMLLL